MCGDASSISVVSGLSSDEFNNHSFNPSRIEFSQNSLLADNFVLSSSFWTPAFRFIFYCNSILEGLDGNESVSEVVAKQVKGEAKFIRAFCYLNLVNLFGDVPIVLTTDFHSSRLVPRASQNAIYDFIISELTDAKDLLSADFSISNGERIRPIKAAASALLARVYLYTEQWADAEIEATEVIDDSNFKLVEDVSLAFLSTSSEAIWQLRPVSPGINTNEAVTFIATSTPAFVSLHSSLLSQFEVGDTRRVNWVGQSTSQVDNQIYYFPYKYKLTTNQGSLSEYSVVLRLAEQYLIRAEARARQNKLSGEYGALSDLNIVRTRAGLTNTSAAAHQDVLSAIFKERQVELFSEWGHRWFDLKRSGLANAVMQQIKTGWQETDLLYPIPRREIEANPNLTQNNGY